eukprot:CAMPEP_0173290704 /NCGR_PEP_ID=MMETSP1143-20121109/11716_1 /TAXON_ID=483371 /ORGANISM="non described non described, Strain CCMP2298" /LENGTH=139 /DNA_ID=CAMNT_0014229801 /DNA_START=260 /DNA_END=679 /DNA_ORIENTATION=+
MGVSSIGTRSAGGKRTTGEDPPEPVVDLHPSEPSASSSVAGSNSPFVLNVGTMRLRLSTDSLLTGDLADPSLGIILPTQNLVFLPLGDNPSPPTAPTISAAAAAAPAPLRPSPLALLTDARRLGEARDRARSYPSTSTG